MINRCYVEIHVPSPLVCTAQWTSSKFWNFVDEEVIGLFRNRKFLVRSKGGKTKTTRGSRVIIDEGLRRESRGGVRVESGVRARDEGRIRDV